MSSWIQKIIKDTKKELQKKQKEHAVEVEKIRSHQRKLSSLILPVLRAIGDELYGHSLFLRRSQYTINIIWTPYYCAWDLISKNPSHCKLRLYCPGLQKFVSAHVIASHYKRPQKEDFNWNQVEGMKVASRSIETEDDVKKLLEDPIREILRSNEIYSD